MTDQPLISIIVPVYNAEKYLRYCVDSIINQTYRNLEIILVDDGATDRSPEICDEYAAKDPRITVIHQSNGGIGKAQNSGLDAAHGDYIAFADNDDMLDRRNIEILLHALLQTGADMSKGRWKQFGLSQLEDTRQEAAKGVSTPDKIIVFKHALRAYQTVFTKTGRILGELLGKHTESCYFNEANWCRLYKRELWDGIRFPHIYAQDVCVAGELYRRMRKVADVNSVLYYWLQSSGSVTHSKKNFDFYHDNYTAGHLNLYISDKERILPQRSYYTMMGAYWEEQSAKDYRDPSNRLWRDFDTDFLKPSIRRLSAWERLHCEISRRIRLMEKVVYDLRVKNMK